MLTPVNILAMLASMPPQRAQYHHGDLRRALIDATLALGAERGAVAVSLREAARAAGVSQTAPYRHFPDKLAMLCAASEEGFRLLHDQLRAAVAACPPDPVERLSRLAAAYVEFAVRDTPHFRLMFGHGSPPKASTAGLQSAARDAFQLQLAQATELVRARALAGVDPRRLALQVWSLAHGMANLAIEAQTLFLGIPAQESAAVTYDAVSLHLRGLVAPSPAPSPAADTPGRASGRRRRR